MTEDEGVPRGESGRERPRARRTRLVLAALMPFAFIALQWALSSYLEPLVWSFLYPAVFLSSWLGGAAAGLQATAISVALVWGLFFWPSLSEGKSAPLDHLLSTTVFVGTGALFSLFHGKLKAATRRTLRSLEEREILARSWETLASSLDYRETLEHVAELAVSLLGDLCAIDVVDREGRARRLIVRHADPQRQGLAEAIQRSTPAPGRRHPLWTVLETGRPLVDPPPLTGGEALSWAVSDEHRRALEAAEVRSIMLIPLVARGRVLAVLTVARCGAGRRYGADDLRLGEELARRAALAIDNAQLHQQSRLQAAVTAHLAEGVVLVRVSDGTIVYTNPRLDAMYGYGPGEVLGRHISVLNAPGDLAPEETAARILGELALADEWHGEMENIRKDGSRFWSYVSVAGFDHPEHGKVWLAVQTDTTERKRLEEAILASLEEKEMLLKEVHHRVKNNLQVISSLFYLQRERVEDEQTRTLLDESRARVQSIALIHEQLYQSTNLAVIDFDAYLRRLIANILSTYDAVGVDIEIQSPGVVLDIERAVPCGLLVSELVSNALKHAFGGRPGKVRVRGSVDGTEQFVFEVADDGAGIPEGFDWQHASSLGLRLVQSLARQLRGTIELDRSRGTRFVLRFGAVSR